MLQSFEHFVRTGYVLHGFTRKGQLTEWGRLIKFNSIEALLVVAIEVSRVDPTNFAGRG
jgi:hypothetical protein